jgi:type IV secretion system protein VirD4
LIDAGPREGAENLDFFLRLAEQLLWPHLYLAAANGRTMRDVVRWILAQTSPLESTDLAALAATITEPAGSDAHDALLGTWALDRRTRASAYATAQTLLGAWTDPNVVAASDDDDIDLAWLLEGNNTLYVCAPLHHQQRLAPVFGGLLGDLVNQAYERVNRTNQPLPTTLVVLDEAANTPARWLPHVASTCAGIGILLVTIWQSKTQLDAAYGRLADSVLTNHATKLIFAGVSDLPTLDYAARLVGDEVVARNASHVDRRDGHHGLTVSSERTALIPAHVLRQIQPGHALLIHATLPPAHLTSRPYYRNRRLRARADTGAQPVANDQTTSATADEPHRRRERRSR